MKTLVIKGHPTRGKEVIETLEMLGGKNEGGLNGKSRGFYFIGCNNNIFFRRASVESSVHHPARGRALH